MKKKVLFVSESPLSTSGIGGMMKGVLSQLDRSKFEATLFSVEFSGCYNPDMALTPLDIPIVSAKDGDDFFGKQKLLDLVARQEFDVVLIVGFDIWQYLQVFNGLKDLQNGGKQFRLGAIFPWDIQKRRDDWVDWVKMLDFPYVYSQFGYDTLKPVVDNIKYYRPLIHNAGLLVPRTPEDREGDRRILYPGLKRNEVVFGFVGKNQIRKDIQRLIKGFSIAIKKNDNISLYLHTEQSIEGKFNIIQYAKDCEIPNNYIRLKKSGKTVTPETMVRIFGSFDCLINCSLQEGLSWTPLEAMFCGTPVIASDTTAQTEIVKDAGVLVKNTIPTYLPLYGQYGATMMDAMACSPEDISEAILRVAGDSDLREKMREDGLKKSAAWLDGVSNINTTLDEMCSETKSHNIHGKKKIDAILFAQHSSAGDVLMTTQCFKGIKERHKGKKLVYMTQEKFMGVVKDNPYIDEIIPWDDVVQKEYSILYNPHSQKILPGNFNSGDVKLHAMYPYFCKIKEPDKMFIAKDRPDIEGLFDEDYIVVNTAGASEFRRYSHMSMAVAKIGYKVVLMGIADDPACDCDFDLRDRLTYTESAYVMDKAVGAIVTDSFCSHLAGAVETPAVVLYGPAPARVVGPRYDDRSILVELEPNKLEVCPVSSNCYGQPKRNVCKSPCINTISHLVVKHALLKLIGASR